MGQGNGDAQGLLRVVARLRAAVQERVQETNAMTEREVMAAAESIQSIVNTATAQIGALKQVLTDLGRDSGGSSLQSATRDQLVIVEAFSREMAEAVEQQHEAARQAVEQLEKIQGISRAVDDVARTTRILTINALVEAARAGDKARGFSVIANELHRLSTEMASSGQQIGMLARTLSEALPRVADNAAGLKRRSEEFSSELTACIRNVDELSERLRERVSMVMEASDAALSKILKASHAGLSHLQFQDAVAQGLARIDGWFHRVLSVVGARLGFDWVDSMPPPAHHELGGDKKIDQKNAGEVLLF